MNDSRLRFCSKCGNALVLTPSGGSRIAPKRLSWWERRFGSQQRADRRAYRRSLPPFYRWRRVIIGGVVVGLASASGIALVVRQGKDPDNPVADAWYTFSQQAVPIEPVKATIVGPQLARGTTAAGLTDTNFVATTINWVTPRVEGNCKVSPIIELSWSTPVRVRWIAFRPGLPMYDSTRRQEFRPKTIEVSTGNPGRCITLPDLTDDDERQQFAFDSKDPVVIDPPTLGKITKLRIAVRGVYDPEPPPDGAAATSLLSFTEIRLFRMRDSADDSTAPVSACLPS